MLSHLQLAIVITRFAIFPIRSRAPTKHFFLRFNIVRESELYSIIKFFRRAQSIFYFFSPSHDDRICPALIRSRFSRRAWFSFSLQKRREKREGWRFKSRMRGWSDRSIASRERKRRKEESFLGTTMSGENKEWNESSRVRFRRKLQRHKLRPLFSSKYVCTHA